ncbi:MAG: hypothetical protein HY006_03480 [Candidatus Sungbacteria bacterium]|nr:hypothetical protein [Candidatus Sungbacteria bacterium]
MVKHPLFDEHSIFSQCKKHMRMEGHLAGYMYFHQPDADETQGTKPIQVILPASAPRHGVEGEFKLVNLAPLLRIHISCPSAAGKGLFVFVVSSAMLLRSCRNFGTVSLPEMFSRELLKDSNPVPPGIVLPEILAMMPAALKPLTIGKEAQRFLSAIPAIPGTFDSSGEFMFEMNLGPLLPLKAEYLAALVDM